MTDFIGREISRTESYSQETARRIDQEVQKIIDDQYQRAREIITQKRDALEKIANALLEFETIEGRHVMEIIEHGEIRSPVHREIPTPRPPELPPTKKPVEKGLHEPGLGGAPAPSPA